MRQAVRIPTVAVFAATRDLPGSLAWLRTTPFWVFFCHGFERDSARNPPEFVIIADLDARLKVAPPSRYFGHVCVRCVSRCHEQTVDGLLKNTLETIWWLNIIYSAEGDFFGGLLFEQYGW